jgi:hypothetical protein
LQDALHEEPPHQGAEERRGTGGDDGAHHLPAALGRRGARPARPRGGAARGALPRGRGRCSPTPRPRSRPYDLSGRPLETGLVEQPAGALEPRDPPAY